LENAFVKSVATSNTLSTNNSKLVNTNIEQAQEIKLPGRDKEDGNVLLENALVKSVATSNTLSTDNSTLSTNNSKLVNTNAKLINDNFEKAQQMKAVEGKIKILEKQPASLELETKPAGSTKKVAVTPGSTKKKKVTTTKDHDFADNEKVTIKDSYSRKPD
jgi:hypothetical protein